MVLGSVIKQCLNTSEEGENKFKMAVKLLQIRKQIQLLRKMERLKYLQIFPYEIDLFWHCIRL